MSVQQLVLNLFQSPEKSLDNYVVGQNAQAVAALREIVLGAGSQFVYIWGESGVGLTHLLCAVDTIRERVPVFENSRSVYVVDDVQTLETEDQEKLFALMNAIRANPGSHLVCAGDAPPQVLAREGMRIDVTSRLGWGLVFNIQPLTDEEKMQTLLSKAKNRGIDLSEEMLSWMQLHLPRDMRSLSNLLEEIDNYSMAQKRQITIPLLKEWLNLSK